MEGTPSCYPTRHLHCDYTRSVSNGSGPGVRPELPSLYTGPFRNWSGTDPKLDVFLFEGPVLDLFWPGARFSKVPKRFRTRKAITKSQP